MKFVNLIFIIFHLISTFKSTIGFTDYSDSICLSDLLYRSKQSINFPLEKGEDYCTKYSFEFDCDENGYIGRIYFKENIPTYQFKSSDFNCFKNIISFIHNGVSLDTTFFSSGPIRLKETGSSTDTVFNGVINLSSLVNKKSHTFFGPNINATYNNDLTQDIYWDIFEASTNNIPSGKHLNIGIDTILFPSKWFDQSSYSNFTSYQSVTSLVFDGTYSNGISLDFPKELLDKTSIGTASSLLFQNLNFKQPLDYLDFSKQTVDDLIFSGIQSSFLIDGKIPFKNIVNREFHYQTSPIITDISNFQSILSNSETVHLSSNGITNNMDDLIPLVNGKLKRLELSSNKLVGTLNEKFCNIQDLNINSNKIGGTLNSCFTCHFGPKLDNSYLRTRTVSNFTNWVMPTEPCKTIVPNLRFDFANNRTYLFGRDLGLLQSYFTTEPTATWYTDVPSESFYKHGTETSTFYVYFRFPGLNLTVTATPQQPIIDNIYVSNDGNLTINGTNFSYNTSLIQVAGKDGIRCTVTYATFNQIFCTLATFSDSIYIVDADTGITIDKLSTVVQLTIIPDFLNQYLECSVDCKTIGNSFCDRNSGSCICDCNYNAGETCNIKSKSCSKFCPSNCNYPGNGICNGIDGTCTCNSDHYGESCENEYLNCASSCGSNGICNRITATCECDQDYYGASCENKYIQCGADCGANGYCNTSIGECKCDQEYYGESCESKYIQCSVDCGANGVCNKFNGVCLCNQDFHGETCDIQQHYVSSIQHSILTYNSGNVILSGLFTQVNNNLTVDIGSLNCKVLTVNETTIVCNLESGGSGIQTTTVKQNGLEWSRRNSFQYLTPTKLCPNNCTSNLNGVCNSSTGICNCINSFKGPDCSLIGNANSQNDSDSNDNKNVELPPSTPSIDKESGSAAISNQEVLYDILITKLVEFNIAGQPVKIIDLQNKWILDNSSSNNDNNVSVFSQIIDNNQNSVIKSRLEIVDTDSDYSFAGVDFFVEAGSIKISINISNYKYLSNLNTIQLQIQSNVTENQDKKENSCNDKQTSIEGFDDISAINYIKIQKNGRILNGKLINYALSDSRPTLITSGVIESSSTGIVVGINLPHFTSTLSIDPDFQVLLETNFKTKCGKSRASYVIPLSVALPIIGIASITAATIFYIRKRKNANEFKSIKLKMNKINQQS